MGTSPPRRAKKFWPKGHDAEPDLRRAIDVIPQLVWSAFPDGAVEFCNQPWLEYTGLTAEQAQGWGWKAAIHPEDLDELVATWRRVLAEGVPGEAEARMRKADGSFRWFLIRAMPQRDHQGRIARWYGTNTDIDERKRAEQALSLANDRLGLAMEASASVGWDSEVKSGRDVWFGDLQTIFGIPSDTYPGSVEEFIRYVHPDDRQQVSEALVDARQYRKLYAAEFRIVRPDGTVRWLVARGKFYYAANGDPERMLGISLDITERKRAEETLSVTSDRLRLALEAGGAGGWEWDIKSGRNLWFGKAHALVGMTPEAYSGSIQEFWDRVHAEDRVRLHDAVENAKQNNTEFNEEFRVMWPDGTVHWLRSQGRYFYAASGEPERMLGISVDITERKRAEEAFRQSELRYKEVFDNTSDCIFLLDVTCDGRFKFAGFNPAEEEAVGFSNTAVSGRFVEDVAGEKVAKGVIANYRRCVEVGTLISYEEELNLPIGRRYFHTNLIPVRDAAGRIHRIVGVARDTTERKRSLEALRASEEWLRLAIQTGRMYAFEWNAATDVIVRSGECANILNWTDDPTHDTGRRFVARVHPEDRKPYTATETGPTPENPTYQTSYRVLRPDSSVIWLEESGRAFFDGQGKMLRTIGMTVDVTDRKRIEEALLRKGAELAEAQRLAGVGSWQWDARTDTVLWSEELYRLVGRDPKLPAPSYKEQPSFFTAESWGRLQRAVEDALQTGTSYQLDMEIVRSDFTTKWAIARGEPLRDEGGRIIGLRGTVQDITERKRAEEALSGLSGKLIEAQEQERTRIARDLHDDIGQRLALLAIDLEQIKENLPNSAENARSHVEELRKRMVEISTDVQALSHELHSPKLDYLGLVAAMRSFCKEFGEQQKVEVDFIHADIPDTVPQEISLCLFRVLQESLHNAVKHSGVRHFEVELRGASDAIHLTMRDLGLGFDPEGAMKGRGLGLTSMQERLKVVNGELSINSQPKRGTTIHARVPLISGTSSVRAAG